MVPVTGFALEPSFRGLVVDMDGVLYRGDVPLEGLAEFVALSASWPRVFLTNNSTLSAEDCAAKLDRMGVSVPACSILTVSAATGAYLADNIERGSMVYVIGERPLRDAVVAAGMTIGGRDSRALVVGLDRRLTYDHLADALFVLGAGRHYDGVPKDGRHGGPTGGRGRCTPVPFIATSFDPVLLTPDGVVPGSGAIIQAIRACIDVTPVRVGKPSATFFELAARHLGLAPDRLLVVGDSLESDIGGGQSVGAQTALVLSGLTQAQPHEQNSSTTHPGAAQPDGVFPGLPEFTAALAGCLGRAEQAAIRFVTAAGQMPAPGKECAR